MNVLGPTLTSLQIGVTATLLAMLVAVPAAYALAGRRGAWRTIAEAALMVPLVLPPTVVGLALVVLLGRNGPAGWLGIPLVFTLSGATIAAAVVAVPLVYLPSRAAFASIDGDLVDAAKTMGAGRLQLAWHVRLPLARRGVTAGVLLGFARALGEFGATLMVLGWQPGKETLPIAVYAGFERGDLTAAAWPALILAGASVVLMVGYNLLPAQRHDA